MKRNDSYALLVMTILIAIFPWIVAGNKYFISILVFLGPRDYGVCPSRSLVFFQSDADWKSHDRLFL